MKPTAKKKAAVKKAAVKKAAVKKAAPAKKASPKKAPARAAPATKAPPAYGPRADLGAPIDEFFTRQPATLRPILDRLLVLIGEAAPEAESSIKWGMPFFSVGSAMMCALGGHRSHVNLILSGPPGTFDNPEGRLTGEGKTGKHLKLTAIDQLPEDSVRGWLGTAAQLARKNASQ